MASSVMVVGETGTAVCVCTDDDLFSSSNLVESGVSKSSLIIINQRKKLSVHNAN